MSLVPASIVPPPYRARSLRAGGWDVTELSDGFLRLDGGGMWGVVPATMWRALTPPDADNRILIALRPFLARKGEIVAVIECGIGARWDAKKRTIYGIEAATGLAESLARCGVRPEQVTHVVASHAHWDHFGAAVVERGGALAPLFPNARHYLPKIEIANALNPDHVRRASYRAEDVEPLARAGLLVAYEGSAEIVPGLRAHVLGGHSDGVAVITLDEERDDGAIFWSDIVPTAHHVQPPYIMAYDIDVARSFEVRAKWIARAAERGWIGLFYHDVDTAFGRIEKDGKRYRVVAMAGSAP
ncbi:MAG: MBL fold metallo-hydrolase [Planctomycetes bacterium]|nr:MBL fold metallo-hydrolase [Planctomycetota bacterium]